MAGFLDSIFNGSPLPNVGTYSTTEQNVPQWVETYLRNLASKADAVAGEDYQQYTGPRIAGINPDRTAAYARLRSGIGQYDPYFDEGHDYISSAGGGFDQAEFDNYFNPYIDSVTNRIADLGARNLDEKLLPRINSTFTGAGQFGSSRHADFTNRALRDTQESILGEQARAMASGYTDAMKNYQEGQGRTLAAGKELGTLGTAGQTAYLKDVAAQEGVGTQLEAQDQKNLDLGYSDFLAQRDYPRQNVNFLSTVLRGQAIPTSQSTQTSAPATQSQTSASPLAQIGGAGAGVFGMGKAFGWFKKGGAVKREVPPMGKGIGRYNSGGAALPAPRGIGSYRMAA